MYYLQRMIHCIQGVYQIETMYCAYSEEIPNLYYLNRERYTWDGVLQQIERFESMRI